MLHLPANARLQTLGGQMLDQNRAADGDKDKATKDARITSKIRTDMLAEHHAACGDDRRDAANDETRHPDVYVHSASEMPTAAASMLVAIAVAAKRQ